MKWFVRLSPDHTFIQLDVQTFADAQSALYRAFRELLPPSVTAKDIALEGHCFAVPPPSTTTPPPLITVMSEASFIAFHQAFGKFLKSPRRSVPEVSITLLGSHTGAATAAMIPVLQRSDPPQVEKQLPTTNAVKVATPAARTPSPPPPSALEPAAILKSARPSSTTTTATSTTTSSSSTSGSVVVSAAPTTSQTSTRTSTTSNKVLQRLEDIKRSYQTYQQAALSSPSSATSPSPVRKSVRPGASLSPLPVSQPQAQYYDTSANVVTSTTTTLDDDEMLALAKNPGALRRHYQKQLEDTQREQELAVRQREAEADEQQEAARRTTGGSSSMSATIASPVSSAALNDDAHQQLQQQLVKSATNNKSAAAPSRTSHSRSSVATPMSSSSASSPSTTVQVMVWGMIARRGIPLPFNPWSPPTFQNLINQSSALLDQPVTSFMLRSDADPPVDIDIDDDNDVRTLAEVVMKDGVDHLTLYAQHSTETAHPVSYVKLRREVKRDRSSATTTPSKNYVNNNRQQNNDDVPSLSSSNLLTSPIREVAALSPPPATKALTAIGAGEVHQRKRPDRPSLVSQLD